MSAVDPAPSAATSPAPSAATWRDPKRHLWLFGLVVPMLAFVAVGMFEVTGWGVWLWTGPIVVLGIVPVIDLMAGIDRSNPPDDVIAQLEEDRYYRWITWLYLPIQYVALVGAMWVVSGAAGMDLGTWDKVGLATTVGVIGGIGINTAHELGHKREDLERWLSRIALAQSFYGHFYIEHNRGHHVRVATPLDPASARIGESFHRFWPRTVLGGLRNAWRLESRRQARRGRRAVGPGNDILGAWAMSLVLWAGLVLGFGIAVLPWLVLQAVVGFTLLEVVNYMEHYGLLRERVGPPGRQRWERVSPRHSWNSNNVATNVLLYHLQRHSDHHANPTRRYQSLRDCDTAPVLPTGYAGMILLALVPPLWRRVMDPRVVAHCGGDLRRAHVDESRRARLEARFPPPTTSRPPTPADRGDPGTGGDHGDAVDPGTSGDPGHLGEILAAECPGCGYRYDVHVGDEHEGFNAGTGWDHVPDDWWCPDCGVRTKSDFVAVAPIDA